MPKAYRSTTLVGALGKFTVWWMILGALNVRQRRLSHLSSPLGDFQGLLPDFELFDTGSDLVKQLFGGDSIAYYPEDEHYKLVKANNNVASTSTVERLSHKDYVRSTSDDMWCYFDMKYSIPYDTSKPLKYAHVNSPAHTLSYTHTYIYKIIARHPAPLCACALIKLASRVPLVQGVLALPPVPRDRALPKPNSEQRQGEPR